MANKRAADLAFSNPSRKLRGVLSYLSRYVFVIGADADGPLTNAPDEYFSIGSFFKPEEQFTFSSPHAITMPGVGFKPVKYVESPQSVAATHSNEVALSHLVVQVPDTTHLWMVPISARAILPCSGLSGASWYYLRTDGTLGTTPNGRYTYTVGQTNKAGTLFFVNQRIVDTQTGQWL